MEPDYEVLGRVFGVSPGAARDYFQGGSHDPVGCRTIADKMNHSVTDLLDYAGEQYIQRLLIACIRRGVPSDQLHPIAQLARLP